MRLITALLLASAATTVMAAPLHADDLPQGLEALDTGKLAIDAAPSLPPLAEPPDLALSPPATRLPSGEAGAPGSAAPVPASPAAPAISWSGYTRAGVVYRRGN